MILLSNVEITLRAMRRRPLFAALAVATLALGIGANTAVFSVANSLLLQRIPAWQPERLVGVFTSWEGIEAYGQFSWPDYQDLRAQSQSLNGIAAQTLFPVSLTGPDAPHVALAFLVSANYFDVLGLRPALGRFFLPDEERAFGAQPVAVISHAYWRKAFAADPSAVGAKLRINNIAFQIVGIAPSGFTSTMPGFVPEVWVPITMVKAVIPAEFPPEDRGQHWFQSFARLRDGVQLTQARSEAAALGSTLSSRYPKTNRGASFNLVPLQQVRAPIVMLAGATRAFLGVLGVLVGILLLLACANLAGMLLARAAERQKEMAMRTALGASRPRLLLDSLTESALLAVFGAAAGLLVARLLLDSLTAIPARAPVPMSFDFPLDPAVLVFTLTVSAAATLAFGLAPALHLSRADSTACLKEHGAAPLVRSRTRWLSVLVSAQAALSVLLLLAAGLCVKSLREALRIHPGFRTANALVAPVNLGYGGYDETRGKLYYRNLLDRVRSVGGVASASLTSSFPLTMMGHMDTEVPNPESKRRLFVSVSAVAPDFFETMGITLLRGRPIDGRDGETTARVAVINQLLADRLWPGKDPIGRSFRGFDRDLTVIGVVPTGKYTWLGERPSPYFYVPLSQLHIGFTNLIVRTNSDARTLTPVIQKTIDALDPSMPSASPITFEDQLSLSLFPSRLAGYAIGGFGALSLILALIGVYGLTWYSANQRRHEFGVRMAMGAAPGRLINLIVRRSVLTILPGLALGTVASAFLLRPLRAFLFGLSPLDPAIYLTIPTLLVAFVALVSLAPATRAAHEDPLQSLHCE